MIVAGSCLCGKIAYEVRTPFSHFVHCHCSRCRKSSGGSHTSNAVVAPEAFRWTRGEAEVMRFDLPAASSFATAFCRHCGSQLPHATRSGRAIILPAGSLDADPREGPTRHAFWSSRAPWTKQPGDLPVSE